MSHKKQGIAQSDDIDPAEPLFILNTTPQYANVRAIPLVVAVTGHRDLVPAAVPEIRERIAKLFSDLQRNNVDSRLQLMSALAEGADQLAAEVALELNVELVVTLPMEKGIYRNDFASADARHYACRRHAL